MPKYRQNLPLLGAKTFLTDGGLETTLIFLEGFELPEFAAFVLLQDKKGRAVLKNYFERYAMIAVDNRQGLILETPTYRTSAGWGRKLGLSAKDLDAANRDAITLMAAVREDFETKDSPFVISGCIGPEGDGYAAGNKLSVAGAEAYHAGQIGTFAATEADIISAYTIPYAEEAIGIASAAKKTAMPCVISFTVETDGRLPSGQTLKEVIAEVDAATGAYPIYYMINCAHPSHFAGVLKPDEAWTRRIHAVRVNASCKSHAELNESDELDAGNPAELGVKTVALRKQLPNLNVIGGCCGTDDRHIAEIAKAWVA